jgi:hypothetical protein
MYYKVKYRLFVFSTALLTTTLLNLNIAILTLTPKTNVPLNLMNLTFAHKPTHTIVYVKKLNLEHMYHTLMINFILPYFLLRLLSSFSLLCNSNFNLNAREIRSIFHNLITHNHVMRGPAYYTAGVIINVFAYSQYTNG